MARLYGLVFWGIFLAAFAVPVVQEIGAPASSRCDPSYPDICLRSDVADYDCESGAADGPKYVSGPVEVRGSDPFDLDRDGDGTGCDAG